MGRDEADTCIQKCTTTSHIDGWERMGKTIMGALGVHVSGPKGPVQKRAQEPKTKKQTQRQTENIQNSYMQCVNAQMQHTNLVEKKPNQKKKQRKQNAKHRGRIDTTQRHPQYTGRAAKNAQERQINTTKNHNKKYQKNKHTVLPQKIAKKHKNNNSKNAEYKIILSPALHARGIARAPSKTHQNVKRARPRAHCSLPTQQATVPKKIRHQ